MHVAASGTNIHLACHSGIAMELLAADVFVDMKMTSTATKLWTKVSKIDCLKVVWGSHVDTALIDSTPGVLNRQRMSECNKLKPAIIPNLVSMDVVL